MNKDIAILLPAYNEEQTIAEVINDFYNHYPEATLYVIDNNSTDNTHVIAEHEFEKLGCKGSVFTVVEQGKANAIRYAFQQIDADIYVMADADHTYFAEDMNKLIKPIINDTADMVIGDRLTSGEYTDENKRSFHDFGNNLVKRLINSLFHTDLSDIMSGYRAFSRHFVKNYPILCEGFELETEMTIHGLQYNFRIKEEIIHYKDRPAGSESKLNTFSDGYKVMRTILMIFKDYHPLPFFTWLSLMFLILGIAAGIWPILDYIREQYVHHVPLAILAVGCMLFSLLLIMCGFILDTVVKLHRFNFEHNLYNKELHK